MKIEVDKKLWEIKRNQFNPRELGGKRDAELERIVRKLLEAECIRRSRSSFYSFAQVSDDRSSGYTIWPVQYGRGEIEPGVVRLGVRIPSPPT